MRHLSASLLALLLPAAAWGQVSTNDQSLDALKPTAPTAVAPAAPSTRHTKAQPHPKRATHTAPAKPATKTPARPATAKPPPPLANAPPANPVIAPPPFVMPAHKPPPPPPVPVKAGAEGTATNLPGGVTRVTFGAGASDLNPVTAAAIRAIALAAVAHPAQIISVTAWCSGTNDDPSTPRRISLDRALAARAVLINAGVVSERIHAVAKGFNDAGDGPLDRVDISAK